MTTPAPALTLDELTGHLDGYTDPAKLVRHLRSPVHGKAVHAASETCLYLLRADHETDHAEDLRVARIERDNAEDAAAEGGFCYSDGSPVPH